MGSGTSNQRLGERVLAALKKLEADTKMQSDRTEQVISASPETLEVIVQSIADAFERCSPFSDATLLVAFKANPEEVQRILAKSCKKVMSAPIDKSEYDWFKVCVRNAPVELFSEMYVCAQQYVFPSSVWMMRNQRGEFLFEQMMKITKSMSEKIDNSMDSIFNHLQSHDDI